MKLNFASNTSDILKIFSKKNGRYNSLIIKHILILLKVNHLKIQNNINELLFNKD